MTKKIDLYCEGDCWNPGIWSATPYELAIALKEMGFLNNTYDVNPFKNESLASHYFYSLPYIRVDKKGIYSLRESIHPSHCKKSQKKAFEFYKSNSKPDSIITIGDLAIFDKTPYFTLQDLDINMLIKWREEKRATYMFDRVPVPLLEKCQKIQQEVYENASGIFVSSQWIKNNICSYISEPQKVFATGIGHGYSTIELNEEILRERFENPVLIFIGRDGTRKGIEIVIEAFRQVKSEFKNMKLRIVTNRDQLSKQAKKLIIDLSEIELYSNVEPKKLADLYMSSSLFVMPSKFEPFGKVFFEAMAFGLPVIGANTCAMPEFIIDNYNGYTPSAKPEEVAEKIKEIFKSFEKYKKLSKNATVVSDKYREKNVVTEMLSIIDKRLS